MGSLLIYLQIFFLTFLESFPIFHNNYRPSTPTPEGKSSEFLPNIRSFGIFLFSYLIKVKIITPVITTENIEKIKDLTQFISSSIFIEIAVPLMINNTHKMRTILYNHSGVECIASTIIKGYQGAQNEYPVIFNVVSYLPLPPKNLLNTWIIPAP